MEYFQIPDRDMAKKLDSLVIQDDMDAYLHADNGIRMYDGYGMNMGYVRAGQLINLNTNQGNIWDVMVRQELSCSSVTDKKRES